MKLLKKMGSLLVLCSLFKPPCLLGQYKSLHLYVQDQEKPITREAVHTSLNYKIKLVFFYNTPQQMQQAADTLMVKGCFWRTRTQQQQQQQRSPNHPRRQATNEPVGIEASYYVVNATIDRQTLSKAFEFHMGAERLCQGAYYPVYLLKNRHNQHINLPKFYLNE